MDASRVLFRVSIEEYLEGEKDAAVKHDYVHGEVFALAGRSDTHNTIALNIALTSAARRKGCRVYASDMKVRVGKIFYYPDVMFVCEDGPDAYYKDKPCVIAEVLSPSTLRTDTNEKRYAYLGLPSLQLCLLVDSRRRFVWGYYRTRTGWEERVFGEGETAPVPRAEVALTAPDIYVQTPYLWRLVGCRARNGPRQTSAFRPRWRCSSGARVRKAGEEGYARYGWTRRFANRRGLGRSRQRSG